jgi:hypothetical protein
MKLLVRPIGEVLKVLLFFNGQVLQDRRRQREHCLFPSCRHGADVPEITARLGCQSFTLALDRATVGHDWKL